ncbi:MAG: 5'-nucleotidase C-terminal domain-containing protein [Sandaracinaceae bacterium]|nr:5'-nucleotidase C-terminal domain-containing protein [Sandaracinaceae bacterium]
MRARPHTSALLLLFQLLAVLSSLLGLPGCSRPAAAVREPENAAPPEPEAPPEAPGPVTLSVIGTNDVHGRVGRMAVVGGYVANLRRARERDGGAVVLLDAGDMFQGTLESNMAEGAPMVAAFNALRYDAAALGNHEFDYGPEGSDATPSRADQDPRGALRARVAEMRFPLLVANLRYRDGRPLDWPGVRPFVMLDDTHTAGVKVGVIGGTTAEALESTLADNVRDLEVMPLAPAVKEAAATLRAAGAQVVLLTVHAGGRCGSFDDPHDLRSCDPDEEIFGLARELGPGVVDLVVAGHSHAGIAHVVHGVPIIESYANGAAFGRADLTLVPGGGAPDVRLYPPRFICRNEHGTLDECETGEYEGALVTPHEGVLAATRDALANAEQLRARPLGVEVPVPLQRRHRDEGPLGNLLTDLMLALYPASDLAVLNAGGVRHSIAAGPLTYGELYEAIPFDNRFALVRMSAREVREMYEANLGSDNGLLLLSGMRVRARCAHGALTVQLLDARGRSVPDSRALQMVTNDFLATGDRHAFGRLRAEGAVTIEAGPPMRDRIAQLLSERGGSIDGRSPALFDPAHLRVDYQGERPVRCAPRR